MMFFQVIKNYPGLPELLYIQPSVTWGEMLVTSQHMHFEEEWRGVPKRRKNNHNCCGFVPISVSNHTPHQYTPMLVHLYHPPSYSEHEEEWSLQFRTMHLVVIQAVQCQKIMIVANISLLVLVVSCGLALRYGQKKIFDIFFQLCFYAELCAGGLNFGIQNHMTTVLKMVHNSFFHDLFYKSF